MTSEELLYLDHNATTPLDPAVLEAMLPFLRADFGNAASRQHALGRRAAKAVDEARGRVAAALAADPREIVFTSGATEANNLALKGLAGAAHTAGRRRILVSAIEHPSVLDPIATLAGEGYAVERLGVDGGGRIDLGHLEAALGDDVLVVSVMYANNEIGTLQAIAAIGALCKARGVLFHTDATQAFGKEPIDVEACGIDLLSLSAHKLYGPKGVGALYVRRKGPRVRLEALLEGGGHERGLRSGTANVPGIVGLGAAAERAVLLRADEQRRIGELRDRLEARLTGSLEGVTVNGARDGRLAGTTNLSFAGVDAESLLVRLPTVCASSSSACTTAAHGKSHVLRAIGLAPEAVDGSVRFSLGRFTTVGEIERAAGLVTEAVRAERHDGAARACR
jgi:cysteine desulfurase